MPSKVMPVAGAPVGGIKAVPSESKSGKPKSNGQVLKDGKYESPKGKTPEELDEAVRVLQRSWRHYQNPYANNPWAGLMTNLLSQNCVGEPESDRDAVKQTACMMVHPFLPQRIAWDLFLAVLLGYVAVVTPYRIGFSAEAQGMWEVLELTVDVTFCVDIIVNFRTAFVRENGKVEDECWPVAKHYFFGFFFIDFVSSVPWDYLIQGIMGSSQAGVDNLQAAKTAKAGRVLKVMRILKLSRLMRFVKLGRIMGKLEDFASVFFDKKSMSLVNLLLLTLALAHLNACAWGYMARANDSYYSNSWVLSYGVINDGLKGEYMAALYWSLTTLTTVGYGDVLPTNDKERTYAMSAMVLGGGFYGYVIAKLAAILTTVDVNNRIYSERMDMVLSYLTQKKFPKALYRRVRDYYRYYYAKRTALDEKQILGKLSSSLRRDVSKFLSASTFSRIALFDGVDSSILCAMLPELRPVNLEQGKTLFCAGDPAYEMFILMEGEMAMRNAAGRVVSRIKAVTYFDEPAAFGLIRYRTTTAEAEEPCHLFGIEKGSLVKCFQGMPAQLQDLEDQVAEKYAVMIKKQRREQGVSATGEQGTRQAHNDTISELVAAADCTPQQRIMLRAMQQLVKSSVQQILDAELEPIRQQVARIEMQLTIGSPAERQARREQQKRQEEQKQQYQLPEQLPVNEERGDRPDSPSMFVDRKLFDAPPQ